ncbi:SCO1664 family protein [Pseudonocardia eucalypti]|uniref:SCO1664 family protein n=1 Tax=Pseudonocardia eucalypti TaxID=648755 RepID=A0ABP9PZS4_9PSEU|nr:putative repeat protein (TIGR03843 family) [Pseudonocardia eucalypti]
MDPFDPAVPGLLHAGRMEVTGRIVNASNATLVCELECDGVHARCVYKPVRGERPLWDFPDGTLADREYASYLISAALAADGKRPMVPPTVLREGPFGPGMVQLWVDTEEDAELVDVCAPADVPRGWLTVLRARDSLGDPALLVHADHPELRRMAVLDVVLNNADRKAGHVLTGVDGRVYGVDHGICLHEEDKLRTVLWGWVGQKLPAEALEEVRALRGELADGLANQLADHLTRRELAALSSRVDALIANPEFPEPSGYGPAIPWPAF